MQIDYNKIQPKDFQAYIESISYKDLRSAYDTLLEKACVYVITDYEDYALEMMESHLRYKYGYYIWQGYDEDNR